MRSLLALATLALAGCATAPAYRAPMVAVPEAFRETDPGRPLAAPEARPLPAAAEPVEFSTRFWEPLGDTTLTRLIDEAVRNNLNVQAAQARVRGARASRTRALLDVTPEGAVSGG